MEIQTFRYFNGKDSSLSVLLINGKFECDVLEDEHRDKKVRGETRIPARTYEIKFRQALTPLTVKYRDKYDWFTYHLELQKVPGFEGVYIHILNWDDQTDGCLGVGEVNRNPSKAGEESEILNSTKTFKRFYQKLKAALEREEKVTIQIVELGKYWEYTSN